VSKLVLKLILYQNWCQIGVKIDAVIDFVLKLVSNWCQNSAEIDFVSKLVPIGVKLVLKLIWYQDWCQIGVKIHTEIDLVSKLVSNWCQH